MKRDRKAVCCVKSSSPVIKNWGFPKYGGGLPMRSKIHFFKVSLVYTEMKGQQRKCVNI